MSKTCGICGEATSSRGLIRHYKGKHSPHIPSIREKVPLMRRLVRDTIVAAIGGLMLLGIVALATQTPSGSSGGYPLPYSSQNAPCQTPNPFNGCGVSYNLFVVGLDYVFWFVVSLMVISGIDLATTRPISRP